ncbi:LAFA_0G18118g1_1 [Lachancea sp. 'fantastica']|nr:LAFA_0G18118g1_1 [Lachancea sp. 'fantastica']
MDVSSITKGYKDEQDDPKVYGDLWLLLKSDPSCTRAVLNDDVVLAHLGNVIVSLSSKCVFKRLVIISVLNFTSVSALKGDVASKVLSAAIETITSVEAEPYAINVCLRTINAILSVCEGEQNIEFLLKNSEYLNEIVKTRQNASNLMDLVYLVSTHPWVSKVDAENWLKELDNTGILWWLRKNLAHAKKLDFLEVIFEKNMRSIRSSRVEFLQSTARSLDICKALQFCSLSNFAALLPTCSISEHTELVRSLNLQLRVHSNISDSKLLEYLTRPTIDPTNYWPRLFSHELDTVHEMWISPSRTMYIHALKVYMHEFARFSHDVEGFLTLVKSRFTEQDGRLHGHSKYASQTFQLISIDDTHEVNLKINTKKLSEGQDFLSEWNKFHRRLIILLNTAGDKICGRIQRVSKDQDVIDATLKAQENTNPKSVHLVCTLNEELETRLMQLQSLLENALVNDDIWQEATMGSLVGKASTRSSVLVSNIFSTSHQLEDYLGIEVEANNEEQNKKRRRKADLNCAVNIDFEKKSYARTEFEPSKPELGLTEAQLQLIMRGLREHLSVINGEVGTGKSTVLASILDSQFLNSRFDKSNGKTIMVCDTEEMCRKMGSLLKIVPPESVICWSENIEAEYEKKKSQIARLLSRVQEIAEALKIHGNFSCTIDAAFTLFDYHLKPMLEDFAGNYPDKLKASDFPLINASNEIKKDPFPRIIASSREVSDIFESLDQWRSLNLPGDARKALWENCDLVLVPKAQLTHILVKEHYKMNHFQNLVLCNANFFQPLEIWQALSGRVQWSNIVITGDFFNGPVPFTLQQYIDEELNFPRLVTNFDTNHDILKLRSPQVSKSHAVPGLGAPLQIIGISGEIARNNVCWDEAEYCVLLYAYLRTIGYPAQSISIITLSPYQKSAVEIELQNLLQSPGFKKLSKPKCINVMYQNYSHRNQVVIITTSGIPFNVHDLSRTAKDSLLILTSRTIKDHLQIVDGEKFPITKPKDKRQVMEIKSLENLKSKIKALQKAQRPEK